MIGTTLSHFRITAKLGEGGMGEVYRAEDTKLGREVAIKVLPPAFTEDPERLARFEREARVLASLNHPHIAGIHQVEEADGLRLLVMEMVQGQDLAERLARGPIPIEQTVNLALQLAEALEAAHERGIVHRDLKPANIKVTPDGQVKVLDFGLAKAIESSDADKIALSISPTLTAGMTGAGVLLGTAAYMAPEQAKGMEADRRADVWAFGAVVWEMLTGKRLFVGDSVSDTLAAVLRDEIHVGELPSATPPVLRSLLGRCLDRDPKSRLRDIGEARVALQALESGDTGSTLMESVLVPAAESPHHYTGMKLPWILAGLMTLVALVLGWLALSRSEAPQTPFQSVLVPPEGTDFDVGNGLAVSPDGAAMAFTAVDANAERALWVLSFETGATERIPGTEGASFPFWSPDGRHIGFMAAGALKRVPIAGGPAQTLTTVRESRGGTWGADGTIVYAPDFRGGLWRIPAGGGEPTPLTEVDAERKEQSHRFPLFLPDGQQLLFLAQTAEGGSQVDDSRIDLLSLATGERRPVVSANSSMAYDPEGHLLFWRQGSLLVTDLDLATGVLRGDPVPMAEGIGYTGNEFATFSISKTGILVYQAGSVYQSLTILEEADRQGEILHSAATSDYHQELQLSHDGRRVVYRGPDNSTLWILDLERETRTRFTFEDGDHFSPIWSPDDQWIVYATNRTGPNQVFRKAASGLGSAELVFETEFQILVRDWSHDGRYLSLEVLDNDKDTDSDVGIYDLESQELQILVQSPFYDGLGTFSPDGRWLSYVSTDSGSMEVFLVSRSGSAGRFQVSNAGGCHPQWSPDGTRLYYVNPRVELMAVDLDLGAEIEIGIPRSLFDIRHPFTYDRPFQVMPDGTTFLVAQLEQEIRGGNLTLIQNWQAKLSD